MWYFRVMETPDGSWECRRGPQLFDRHQDAASAVDHMRRIMAEHAPAELFLHRLDGTVTSAGFSMDPADDT
jgi:hypothetical protein